MSVHQFDGLLKSPLSVVRVFVGVAEERTIGSHGKMNFMFLLRYLFFLEGEFNMIAIKNATWRWVTSIFMAVYMPLHAPLKVYFGKGCSWCLNA